MSSTSSPKALGERVVNFCRARHPSKTAPNVAADTGLGESQVKAWLEARAAPSGSALLSLISAYGPDFLSAMMPERIGWIDDAALQARERALLSEMAETQRKLDDLRRLL